MAVQHGSSLIELDDGSLLVSWYAGGKEGARDSRILVRHSRAGGTSWEPTQIAVNPRECAAESWFSNKTLGNTVLFQDKENIVWLFYAAVEFGGWSGAHVDYKISRDRGRTWSESHRLTNGLGDIPRSKPVELGSHEHLSAAVAFCFMEVLRRRAIGNRQRENCAKDVFRDRWLEVQPSGFCRF